MGSEFARLAIADRKRQTSIVDEGHQSFATQPMTNQDDVLRSAQTIVRTISIETRMKRWSDTRVESRGYGMETDLQMLSQI